MTTCCVHNESTLWVDSFRFWFRPMSQYFFLSPCCFVTVGNAINLAELSNQKNSCFCVNILSTSEFFVRMNHVLYGVKCDRLWWFKYILCYVLSLSIIINCVEECCSELILQMIHWHWKRRQISHLKIRQICAGSLHMVDVNVYFPLRCPSVQYWLTDLVYINSDISQKKRSICSSSVH